MSVKSGLIELLELNKGKSLSGETIAKTLNCTRAAVWKAVKSLQEEGYLIEAVKNRGYCLNMKNNLLSAEGIRIFLNHDCDYIKVYEEVESTNLLAKQMAVQGIAGDGAMIVAASQSAGRGRRGRSFYSPEGGVYFSIILQPRETIRESLLITTAAATAVYNAVKTLCNIELAIKWVNDLYKNSRKVCGILTEAITDFESGTIEYVIVGIGLNLYHQRDEIPAELENIAGALFEEASEAEGLDRNRLIAEIANNLMSEMKELSISKVYIERNIIPGHQIQILDGERSRRAKALKICEDGSLLIEEENGEIRKLVYGEVSICLQKDEE